MDFEEAIDKTQLIALLSQLKEGITNNEAISLKIGEREVLIPADVLCEIEYEQESGQAELEIELKWKISDHETAVEPTASGKFEMFQGKDDQWYFHLKAANNQIILVSQGYASKEGAQKGIASIKANATPEQFEFRVSKSHQPYFVLKAKNGEIIGTSQMYKRKVGAKKGVASVIQHSSAEIHARD